MKLDEANKLVAATLRRELAEWPIRNISVTRAALRPAQPGYNVVATGHVGATTVGAELTVQSWPPEGSAFAIVGYDAVTALRHQLQKQMRAMGYGPGDVA